MVSGREGEWKGPSLNCIQSPPLLVGWSLAASDKAHEAVRHSAAGQLAGRNTAQRNAAQGRRAVAPMPPSGASSQAGSRYATARDRVTHAQTSTSDDVASRCGGGPSYLAVSLAGDAIGAPHSSISTSLKVAAAEVRGRAELATKALECSSHCTVRSSQVDWAQPGGLGGAIAAVRAQQSNASLSRLRRILTPRPFRSDDGFAHIGSEQPPPAPRPHAPSTRPRAFPLFISSARARR